MSTTGLVIKLNAVKRGGATAFFIMGRFVTALWKRNLIIKLNITIKMNGINHEAEKEKEKLLLLQDLSRVDY